MASDELPQAQIGRVVWSNEVYEPSDDSFALVDAVLTWLQDQQRHVAHAAQASQQCGHASTPDGFLPKMCLEVGCGSGFVICSVALALQHIRSNTLGTPAAAGHSTEGAAVPRCCTTPPCSFLAIDISAAALQATTATLKAHQVAGVELVQTDLVAGLLPRLAGAVDLLLFNPPYVPTPDEELARDGIARAWAGGHMGRRVTDRLLSQLPMLLSPQGHAFVVTVPENKPHDIIQMMEALGMKGAVALTRTADEEHLVILHLWRP